MAKLSPTANLVSDLYTPDSRTSAVPDCRRIAKLTSPGVVPIPPLPRPTNLNDEASSVENWSTPLPLTCWFDTAVPSGQPLQPPTFVSVVPFAATFTRLIQVAAPVDGAGAGAVGAGVVGDGAGAGAGVGAGVVGAGATGVGVVGVGAP